MKKYILLLMLVIGLSASGEKKLLLDTFASEQEAIEALNLLKSDLNPELVKLSKMKGFDFSIESLGVAYALSIEPLQDYATAAKVRSLLPKEYSNSFIGPYMKPERVEGKNGGEFGAFAVLENKFNEISASIKSIFFSDKFVIVASVLEFFLVVSLLIYYIKYRRLKKRVVSKKEVRNMNLPGEAIVKPSDIFYVREY